MYSHSNFASDIHNWTDITWYESKFAIPHDPIKFFTRFFTQQEGWGLSMYVIFPICYSHDYAFIIACHDRTFTD